MSVAAVGGAVVGGLISSGSAKSASRAQERAAEQANETQRYMYDTTRADNAPYLKAGTAGVNKLAYLLGLDGYGASGSSSAPTSLTEAQLRAQLAPQYTTTKRVMIPPSGYRDTERRWENRTVTDDAALNAAIQAKLKEQQNQLTAYNAQQSKNNANDPNFGSLLKSFDANDLNNDPIYNSTIDFALDQGTQGINRQAAATGSILSGATLKALSRFGANTAATYGNDAFNRNNIEKTNTYNRLAGISGTGQQAVNTVSAAGQNTANQISNNQTALGNARGASAIAQGNAWSNAIGQGVNAYQQNRLINSAAQNPYAGTGYSAGDIQGLQGYQGIY